MIQTISSPQILLFMTTMYSAVMYKVNIKHKFSSRITTTSFAQPKYVLNSVAYIKYFLNTSSIRLVYLLLLSKIFVLITLQICESIIYICISWKSQISIFQTKTDLPFVWKEMRRGSFFSLLHFVIIVQSLSMEPSLTCGKAFKT